MQLKTIQKIGFLKWQLFKIQFLRKLPFTVSYKKNILQKNKHNLLFRRSEAQQQVIKDLFGSNAYGVVFNTGNGKIINHSYDVSISLALGNGEGYNLEEINILLSLLDSQSVVYVAGTHIGVLAIPIAKKVNTVIGFEANPDTFNLLCDNIHLNNINNILAFNYALYNSDTKLTFHKDKANSGGSKIKPQNDIYSTGNGTTEIAEISAKRLDDICAENNLPAADMLIMDIEGSEYAALIGCPNLLKHCKILYVEFEPHHLRNVSGVSVENFLSVIAPYFISVKIIQEIISGKNISYSLEEASVKLTDLFQKDEPADLIFFKN